MKILVTGATGFIGRDLVRSLIAKGHDIVCLVRKTSNVDPLMGTGVRLVTGDITDAEQVDKTLHEVCPEIVFHAAAKVMNGNEGALFKVNAAGTRNVCQGCYKYGVNRLVYVSSVSVVSGNSQVPLTDDLPYRATNAYGRSKIEAERVVVNYREKGLRVSIIRPCMVYGEDEPHAMDRILTQIVLRRIPLLDTPKMDAKLQLAYVGNVTNVLVSAMEKEGALSGAFIVADREVITLRKFVEILYDELGAGSPPVIPGWAVKAGMIIPPVRDKVNRYLKDRQYDISRAVEILGYDPEVSTEDGLRRTARHWLRMRTSKGDKRVDRRGNNESQISNIECT